MSSLTSCCRCYLSNQSDHVDIPHFAILNDTLPPYNPQTFFAWLIGFRFTQVVNSATRREGNSCVTKITYYDPELHTYSVLTDPQRQLFRFPQQTPPSSIQLRIYTTEDEALPLSPLNAPGDMSSILRAGGVRILLVRHGQSEANVLKSVYNSKPDHAIELTPRGKEMARGAGTFLRTWLQETYGSKANVGHHVRMWVSPFTRTRQTAEEVLSVLNPLASPEGSADCWVDSVRESIFLAEQDFGVFEGQQQPQQQQPEMSLSGSSKFEYEQERNKLKERFLGQFWARNPQGESVFDVCVRLSGLVADIINDVVMPDPERPRIQTVIIVSHGNTLRGFLTSWCRLSPEWFATTKSPRNCSIQLIEGRDNKGYIFPGYEKQELKVAEMPAFTEDPRAAHWNSFLQK
eukprot:PhF_6_TR20838/c0_g1_i1/m.30009